MRRLRTLSARRLWTIVAAVAVLAITGGLAQAALSGSPAAPPARDLDRAVLDALRAPVPAGVSARVRFTNALLPSGSLPAGTASPLLAGAQGRVWVAADGRFRLELQSDAGDAQITSDGERLTVYDPATRTAYRAAAPRRHHTAKSSRPATLAGVRTALADLGRAWSVSGARPGATADRPSYTVRIAPRDDGGLLGAAELAWDAARGTPLRAAVYAQGQAEPVLELEATEVAYGPLPAERFAAAVPPGATVVDLDAGPAGAAKPATPAKGVRGLAAVQRELDFRLAAPAELAGLPRRSVRLVRVGARAGALVTYGEGLGGIAVLAHRAGEGAPGRAPGGARLPQVNLDGATGSELATALGTALFFERGGVAYTVVGSVPPLAAENAARGLR